jgi:NADH-quinone oxidoreductase subunit N
MTDSTLTLARSLPAMPEIYLTLAICVLLLFDLFVGERRPGLTGTFALLLLLGGAVVTLLTAGQGARQLLLGLYVADDLSTLLKLAAFLFTAVGLFYSGDYLARRGLLRRASTTC